MMLRLRGSAFSDDTYSLIDNVGPPGLVFCVTWFSYQNTGPLGLTYHNTLHFAKIYDYQFNAKAFYV